MDEVVMGEDKIEVIINPTNFTPEQGEMLHAILEYGEARNVRAWYPNESLVQPFISAIVASIKRPDEKEAERKKLEAILKRYPSKFYGCKQLINDVVVRVPVKLTHAIVARERINPVTHLKEQRYDVYNCAAPLSSGAHADVFDLAGTLSLNRNGALVFKHKPRVIKALQFTSRLEALTPTSILKKHIEQESRLSLRATHLHAKPATYDDQNSIAFIVMNKYSKTLDQLINAGLNSHERRLRLSYYLLEALDEQVHKLNMLHRDIKPQNIMVDEKTLQVKIIDFGYSCDQADIDDTVCGTGGFAAPEVYQGKHSIKSDIYSIGVVLGLLWGGVFDKEKTIKYSDVDPPVYDVPKIINLFARIPSGLPFEFKARIRAILEGLFVENVNARYDIKQAMFLFDSAILDFKLTSIPHEHHEDVYVAHVAALRLRFYIRTSAKSFENVVAETRAALATIPENNYAMAEFVNTLQMDELRVGDSKRDILARLDAIAKDYRLTSGGLDDARVQLAITLLACNNLPTSVNTRAMSVRVAALDEDIQNLQHKLQKKECDIDGLASYTKVINSRLALILNSHEQLREELSRFRSDDAFLKSRLMVSGSGTPLGFLKNQIRTEVGAYLDSYSPGLFRQVLSLERIRDMHEILDIVDYSGDVSDLSRLLNLRLNALGPRMILSSSLRERIVAILKSPSAAPEHQFQITARA